jgi:hypothetical protein
MRGTCHRNSDEETLANDYHQAAALEGEDCNLERTDSSSGSHGFQAGARPLEYQATIETNVSSSDLDIAL